MVRTAHPWHSVHRNGSRRMALGLMVAFSLTLVAFEWRTGSSRPVADDDGLLALEDPMDHAVVIRVVDPASTSAPKRRARAASAVGVVNPVEPSEPAGPTEPAQGPAGEPVGPATEVLRGPEEVAAPEIHFWGSVGVRPYFMDCLKRSPSALDECTEYRIQKHLEREFKVPPGIRGDVRTTVTFEIDREGRIGKLICAPKVNAEVEREIDRVLRALPQFVPGSQGGLPVPVYYQIPLRVRSI